MNPHLPHSFNHRTEPLKTGRTYHFVDQLPDGYDSKRSPSILCVHGFPDLWYGWRYQIGPWVRKGARVIVPDMLGYGGSDKPKDPSEYSTKKLCDDLAALLDTLGIKKAVVIGHDWGAFTAARFALWHPNRTLALVVMSVPYTPPSRTYIPIEEVAKRAPNLGYQVFFSEKRSTKVLEAHLDKFFNLLFRPPADQVNYTLNGSLENILAADEKSHGQSLLTNEERAFYLQKFREGMEGPLNYYRTSKHRYDEELAADLPSNLRADLPVLFIWGTADATTTPFLIEKSHKFISRLQDVALEGKGHWVMIEARDEVTEIIANWLQGLTSSHPQGKL
ncbi:hypothetical protein AMATHDRAFT_191653 [Amanita thiersii Skay4041]|uniref:AB hydrolase-1 domain-containing protein n=1 Tax=Amanita thiersii Skay4041 TaxID=703135 RepID=A0A2A9NUM2_9AGAR|nr:hypothetical protein AMATHDRAFT_191653 [Amanita thiersii Skay4041]